MNNGFVQANGDFNNATTESTELQVVQGIADDGSSFIINLTQRQVSYCSMKPRNDDEAVILFNAMNSPEKRIKDCINMPIEVKDIFVEVVYPENERTKLREPAPRVVLIDSNGVGYQAVSLGTYTAVKKIMDAFGTPDTWKAPKSFMVKQISKGDRSVLTLEAVRKTK